MRLPDFERVLTQDQEQQPWFKQILEQLNRLFEYCKDAFNGNVSIINLKAQVIDYTFVAPFVATPFKKTKPGKVTSVSLGNIIPLGAFTVSWIDNNDQITVAGVTTLSAGTSYTIRLLAFYE